MSNNTIPIRPPSFSQPHPRVNQNTHQYTNSFGQINHNHNHNHHHVHYNNHMTPKVTPTALPVIIQSKTVKQTTTTITQPFSSNKNNIPPLKTRTHPSRSSHSPSRNQPIYRNNTPIQPLHHHPHPHIIPSHHPRPYSLNNNNFMHSYSQKHNNNIYTKHNTHHHPNSNASTQLMSNNASLPPKTFHFKPPSSSNFVQQSHIQAPISCMEHPLGNVIIDGPVKAPSPIGLDTIASTAPSTASNNASTSPSTHSYMSHANSQHSTPFSYQSNHTLPCNNRKRKRVLTDCPNTVEMNTMPYNSNTVPNQRYNQTHITHPITQRHVNNQPMMMQPPFKKRKVIHCGGITSEQYLPRTPHLIQKHCQATQMSRAFKHMHAPQQQRDHHSIRSNVTRRHEQIQTNAYHHPAPFVNNNISPFYNQSSGIHHSTSNNSPRMNDSHSTPKPTPSLSNSLKPTPKPPKPPTPAITTRRRKQNKKITVKRKKSPRKTNFKPAAKLCAEPRNISHFRLKTNESSNSNNSLSDRIKMKHRTAPILAAELSAGQLAPALMPMPSISSSDKSIKSISSLPPLQPFPLYPQGPMMDPQGPMMPPSPMGPMSVSMGGSPLPLNALQVASPVSPSNASFSMHYPSTYQPTFTYSLESASHDMDVNNNYMDDLKENIVDIPIVDNSPFVISDNERNDHSNEPFNVVDDESDESMYQSQMPLESVDVFEGDEVQYNEYKEKRGELEKKLGWIEGIEIVDTEHRMDIGPLPYFGDDKHNKRDNNLSSLKKAALKALYDVTDLELNDPEVTRLRLVMDDDRISEGEHTNKDSLCLFTSSLIGGVYNGCGPRSLSVPMKDYITHNEYNMTYSMAKRGPGHERGKIKMGQHNEDALRELLLQEWNDAEPLISYKLMIKSNEVELSEDEEEEEEEEIEHKDVECDWQHGGVITDWKRIRELGFNIPSYCLDPSKYSSSQLSDPGCLRESQCIRDPHSDRDIEIHFFIYIPGGDIKGQLKSFCATYPPVVYEIACDRKRQCMLCLRTNKECIGIIDLLNDRNERIWSCSQCKNAFRIGLKLNTRTKQYRVMDMVESVNNNNNNNSNNNIKKVKRCNNKKKKQNKKKTAFCDLVQAFDPYIYNVCGDQYVFRYFEERDLDVLNSLDIKMTTQLLGTDADSYGRVWLNKLTNPARTTHHIWRTVTCAQLLEVKEEDNVDNRYHLVPRLDDKGGLIKKKESSPVAFAMYKHVKNDINITKRYGELFWILVDNKHQRKGIASRLIDIMVNEAQKQEKITEFRLHVLKSNDAAIPLYKKLGFIKKGSKPNYPKPNFESYRCLKML